MRCFGVTIASFSRKITKWCFYCLVGFFGSKKSKKKKKRKKYLSDEITKLQLEEPRAKSQGISLHFCFSPKLISQ